MKHVALHVLNECKRFFGGEGGNHKPVCHRNTSGRRQDLDVGLINGDVRSVEPVDKTVKGGMEAGSRKRFHDSGFAGRDNDLTALRVDQQKIAAPAVVFFDDLIQEVHFAQVDQPDHGADHVGLAVTKWNRHGENGGLQFLVKEGLTDPRLTILECRSDGVEIHVVDTEPSRVRWELGRRAAGGIDTEETARKVPLKHRPRFENIRQGGEVAGSCWVKHRRDSAQCIETIRQFAVGIRGEEGNGRELLFAKQTLHVCAQ